MTEQLRLNKQMRDMQRFNDIYIRFDRTLSSISEIRNHLQQLRLRLNMLSLGHLSPTVISPANLRQLLSEIANQLPPNLKLPFDPNTDLWSYYRILPCTTLVGDENLIIALTVPLLDTNKRFEVFKIHNLPVPNLKTNQSTLLARYKIDEKAVVIDDVRSTYTTLSETELVSCLSQHGNFCAIDKSFYPVSSSNLCVMKIFLNDLPEIAKLCSVSVENNVVDPNAVNLREGKWLITSSKPLNLNVKCGENTIGRTVKSPIDILSLGQGCSGFHGSLLLPPFYNKENHFNMTDSFQNFIDEIDTCTLWEPLNSKYPEIGYISIPDKLKDIKEFPLNTLMAELPVTQLQPMGSSNWVGSPWFYVSLALAVIFMLGICIKKRKTVRKMGSICCGGCWSRCRRRDGDGGEKDSSKGTSYCCVNPEMRTLKQTVELRDITAPKKPRRSGKLEARRAVHGTGTISETLARRFTKEKEDVESPWSKYYQPDPELARRYLEEKAAMSVNQRNVGDVPREVVSPSAPHLYPMIPPMMYE